MTHPAASPAWRWLLCLTLLLSLLGAGPLLAPREAAAASGSTALGGIWSWGSDSNGQLGNGAGTTANQPTPVALAGITGITAVAAGLHHSLALKADGTVLAWGRDTDGQLGNGAAITADQPAPGPVVGVGGGGTLANVVAIAAGSYHSLAFKSDGTVIAWGADNSGQLGNGAAVTATQPAPVVVAGVGGSGTLTNVIAIAAGFTHSLALRADGTVVAWGSDQFGQLGNGAGVVGNQPAPTLVVGVGDRDTLGNVTKIAAGSYHSLALRDNGTPVAWGRDGNGQLGNGTLATADQPAPTRVVVATNGAALGNVTAVAAGQFHSLALKADGTVAAWGADTSGQLGNGATSGNQPLPITVVSSSGTGTLMNVKAIATGAGHALALRADGTIVAWGNNSSGQLGNGGNGVYQPAPVLVGAPFGMTAIGTGGTHSLALQGGAGTSIWGSEPLTSHPQPQPVPGLNAPRAIGLAAGQEHRLALRVNGTVVAWGRGDSGQLGNGTTTATPQNPQTSPVQVVGIGGSGILTNVVAVAAGHAHSLALRADGTVVAWGTDYSGQLGNGAATTADQSSPVPVLGVGGTGILTNVVAIIAGSAHSVALRGDGTVVAWGYGGFGQLGNGAANNSQPAPVPVVGVGGSGMLTNAVAITGGYNHTVTLRGDGTIVAWGANHSGQLGTGAITLTQPSPVQVVGIGGSGALANAVAVGAGGHHSVALRSDGTVVAWGNDEFDQLGNGAATTADQSSPVPVAGVGGTGTLTNVTSIADGDFHTLARRADGTVAAWGYDGSGQLGDGEPLLDQPVPVVVIGVSGGVLTNVGAVAAGGYSSGALR